MSRVALRLRAGEAISDGDFDEVFGPRTSSVSFRHWTPVCVARRAAQLLTEAGATEILDVGAGPGKFCLVGALTTSARFTGVEQRVALVDEARIAAVKLGVERARFVHANFADFDCTPFNAFYFYNPFQEQLEVDDLFSIDDAFEPSSDLHDAYVSAASAALCRAPVGTFVVTFHGMGAPLPSAYHRLHREPTYGGELSLWVRRDRVG